MYTGTMPTTLRSYLYSRGQHYKQAMLGMQAAMGCKLLDPDGNRPRQFHKITGTENRQKITELTESF